MKTIALLVSSLLVAQVAIGDEARQIMQQVTDRDDGRTQYVKQVIATCRYEQKGGSIACAERPRIKTIESVRKDYGSRGKDKKTVMIVLEPSAETGIGFLQYDYEDKDKDTDQWMYLSALGKVKRIVSGDNDEPKTGSLFGSEFSYEDVEQMNVENYQYTMLKEENYQGNDCWIIEAVPTPTHARKSNYGKMVNWIDKKRFLIHKSAMYDKGGRVIKQFTLGDYVLVDNVWVARKLNMMNLADQRVTTLKLTELTLNKEVDDQLLTQRTLTDGAFREGKLDQLRKGIFK